MQLRINSYLPITNVEGVGSRFAIWVQGCSIRCEGCANSHMWDCENGIIYQTKDIITIINSFKDKIEGITWLGGEPLDQIEPVTEVSKAIQELGLSVILFTGYNYSELKNKQDFQKLAKYVDILIDGKYEKDKTDYSRPWVGSGNQNYYFLTQRYTPSIITKYKNKFELHIKENNSVFVNGMGDFKQLNKIIK